MKNQKTKIAILAIFIISFLLLIILNLPNEEKNSKNEIFCKEFILYRIEKSPGQMTFPRWKMNYGVAVKYSNKVRYFTNAHSFQAGYTDQFAIAFNEKDNMSFVYKVEKLGSDVVELFISDTKEPVKVIGFCPVNLGKYVKRIYLEQKQPISVELQKIEGSRKIICNATFNATTIEKNDIIKGLVVFTEKQIYGKGDSGRPFIKNKTGEVFILSFVEDAPPIKYIPKFYEKLGNVKFGTYFVKVPLE